jgi:DNA-binding FrmR family transcriptional regulator
MLKNMITSKSRILRRLKIIEGQVRGLQEMITKDIYCIDVIAQTSAVKNSLASIEDVIMENHLNSCVIPQIKEGKGAKATKEILEVYKLKRK